VRLSLARDPPSVIYPARGIFGLWGPGARSPGDLARLIGKTRAGLLTALADPASTTGLAARDGVPVCSGSVSEHLAVLRATVDRPVPGRRFRVEAGAVSGRRLARARPGSAYPASPGP
jgi:hypothetical protein